MFHLSESVCSVGAPARRHFDFDLHFRLVEAADDHGRRRPDFAEIFAEDRTTSMSSHPTSRFASLTAI
jgi:hypothetical protein